MIGLFDLLEGRLRNLEAERRRDRVLPVRFILPRGFRRRRRAADGARIERSEEPESRSA